MDTIRWMALTGLALCVLVAACAGAEEAKQQLEPGEEHIDAFTQNEQLGRGVNIIGYDPGWRSPDRWRMKDEHFRLIKEAGFSHVRIGLFPFRHMADADEGYLVRPEWFLAADWALEQALANDLVVILDCHEYNPMGRNPEGLKPQWLAFLRQMAERYADAPDTVLFELLCEPCRRLTPEMWNGFLAEGLALVRESNPNRTIIIGPAQWNQIDKLEDLILPEDDRNIIVTLHYYEPFNFTHQGASWADQEDDLGYDWQGTEAERRAIEEDFQKANEWAVQNDRPIFLGEFGAYDQEDYELSDMDSRARWTSFVARQAESHGWSWAYWQFDSNFLVYDIDAGKWVEPIRDALIPPAE